MKHKKIIAAILILIGLGIFGISSTTSQDIRKTYTVKLYSGGNTVATWTAREYGRISDETLVFTIGDDYHPRQVRINGTYSVETSE